MVKGAAVDTALLFQAEPVPPAAGVSWSTFEAGKMALPFAVQPAPTPPNPVKLPAGMPAKDKVPPVRLMVLVPSTEGLVRASLPALTVTPPVKVLPPLRVCVPAPDLSS